MMILGRTVAGQCAVVVDTLHVRSKYITAVSASITGAVMSSVRPAPRSFRSTDAADRRCPSGTG